MTRPRMLLLSHVMPFPGSAGQEQRVRETLSAARSFFHVTFATAAPPAQHAALTQRLAPLCDEVVMLPSAYGGNPSKRLVNHATAAAYGLVTGLKASNYVIGKMEFTPERVTQIVGDRHFDIALFEYWHAASSARVLQDRGILCALDMHDILWKGREQRLLEKAAVPTLFRNWSVSRYRKAEEQSWTKFDAIVAINEDERDYVRPKVRASVPVLYAPMGTDLEKWSYGWNPASPPRIAYYGGLGTVHNRRSAMQCYRDIMPLVWQKHPDAQLWLVGGNPSEELKALAKDPRVVVTGFVPDVKQTLASMTAVLCPWRGTYGFRSRLVEVMATGVPVVASPDAVAGMGMTVGDGLFLARNAPEFADMADHLLRDPAFAKLQSQAARIQMERLFSLDATYLRLMRELTTWLAER